MADSRLLHIIEVSEILTPEEVKLYTEPNKLNSVERYDIEYKIANNPANQELIDAYNNKPNLFDDFKHLKVIKTPLDGYGVELTLLVVNVIFLIIFFIVQLDPKEKSKQFVNKKSEVRNIRKETRHIEKILPESELELNNPTISKSSTKRIKQETIDFLESRPLQQVNNKLIEKGTLNYKKKYPYTYLLNYKVTDYRKIREQNTNHKIELNGVPASSENSKRLSKTERLKTDSVYYMDFLKETLRGFKNQKYSLILVEWDKILSVFPEDDNALFYKAISNYYLSNGELSVKGLLKVVSNPMSNFIEEANWYLALNYYQLEKDKECKKILDKIIDEKTFYSKKAQAFYKQHY